MLSRSLRDRTVEKWTRQLKLSDAWPVHGTHFGILLGGQRCLSAQIMQCLLRRRDLVALLGGHCARVDLSNLPVHHDRRLHRSAFEGDLLLATFTVHHGLRGRELCDDRLRKRLDRFCFPDGLHDNRVRVFFGPLHFQLACCWMGFSFCSSDSECYDQCGSVQVQELVSDFPFP